MGLKNVIYIPVFNRPAFLQVCLEQLVKNPEHKDFLFVFHIDFDYHKQILHVISMFNIQTKIIYQKRHNLKKLPTNILNGYRHAANLSKKYVIMVEPDVFVSSDFIKWHMVIHKQEPNIFCSIATKNNNVNMPTVFPEEIEMYYKSHLTYQSLGVCFDKQIIIDHILPHANSRYYGNLFGYCARYFPVSKIGKIYVEQAGLIRRVQEKLPRLKIVYPFVPRAFHGGFMGKNRIHPNVKFSGLSLNERVKAVRRIAFDLTELRKAVTEERYVKDSIPVKMKLPEWKEQKCYNS